MAYWIVNFKSRIGTLYRVKVGGKTGSDAELLGAADPFYTQEDTSEDKFVPVRLQSGYLRIVDDGYDLAGNAFDWHDLIPTTATSRPVTLYKVVGITETVMWLGYLRPEIFSSEYLAPVQEREFPVCCCLSVLEGFTFDVQPQTQNFAWLLHSLFYDFTILPQRDFYFTGTYAVQEWLHMRINTVNVQGRNCLEVLEEICRFWGWTCRTSKENIIFEAADDGSQMVENDFLYIDFDELGQIGAGADEPGTNVDFGEIEMEGDEFASTDNSEIYLRPVRRVTVKADINKQNGYPAVPTKEIEEEFRGDTIYHTDYGSSSPAYFFSHRNSNTGHETYSDKEQLLSVETWCYYDSGTGITLGGWFDVVDWYIGQLSDKKNYDWTTRLSLIDGSPINAGPYNGKPYLSMQSVEDFAFSNCCIVINATTYVEKCTVSGGTATYKTYTGNGYLICRLKVGDKYASSSGWTTTEQTIQIPIGNGGTEAEGKGSIVTNHAYTNVFDPFEGYGVSAVPETNGPVSGPVTFEILGFHLDDTHGLPEAKLIIENLRMSIALRTDVDLQTDESENTYTADNNSENPNTVEVSTIFASNNNNEPGRGIVLSPYDDYYMDQVTYAFELTYAKPEQHLADRITAFGQTARRLYKLQLRTNEIFDITPLDKVTTADNVTCYPISISRSWRDDITEVYLIEI